MGRNGQILEQAEMPGKPKSTGCVHDSVAELALDDESEVPEDVSE